MKNATKPSKIHIERLRNIGIIAHIDAGKTTLTERILYYTGKIHRMGEVHDGTATMDYMPEEQERGITITSACTTCTWKDRQINIIDTPGHVDFTVEVERSLRVLDGAVGVFCGVSGVEPQSETVWRQSEHYRVPKLAFINKMDRLGANFEAVLESMTTKLGIRPLPLVIPDGEGQELQGLFDVVSQKKVVFNSDSQGEKFEALELTNQEADFLEPWRERLFDTLGEVDDEFLETYLSGDTISEEAIRAAIRRATLALKLTPVYSGSALKNTGVQLLLDGICDFLPNPGEVPPVSGLHPVTKDKLKLEFNSQGPLASLAFKVIFESGRKLILLRLYSGKLEPGQIVLNAGIDKEERVASIYHLHAGRKEKVEIAYAGDIVAVTGLKITKTGDTLTAPDAPVILESISEYQPVISVALEPRNSEQAERLMEFLQHYMQEDPSLLIRNDDDTGQMVLSGMGELHLEVLMDRLRREHGLAPRVGKPEVVYNETVSSRGTAEAEFDRLLGDTAHYGFVSLSVEPRKRGNGNEVSYELDTTAWPEEYIAAVDEGILDSLQSGVVRGFPTVDIRVRVRDIRKKDKGETSVGYRMASSMALKKALTEASPVLLEPIMWLEIGVPDDFVGEVVGLLGSKGAKIENMYDHAGQKVVQALAPLRQLFGFSTELRSATQGRAGMIMKFSRFDVLQ